MSLLMKALKEAEQRHRENAAQALAQSRDADDGLSDPPPAPRSAASRAARPAARRGEVLLELSLQDGDAPAAGSPQAKPAEPHAGAAGGLALDAPDAHDGRADASDDAFPLLDQPLDHDDVGVRADALGQASADRPAAAAMPRQGTAPVAVGAAGTAAAAAEPAARRAAPDVGAAPPAAAAPVAGPAAQGRARLLGPRTGAAIAVLLVAVGAGGWLALEMWPGLTAELGLVSAPNVLPAGQRSAGAPGVTPLGQGPVPRAAVVPADAPPQERRPEVAGTSKSAPAVGDKLAAATDAGKAAAPAASATGTGVDVRDARREPSPPAPKGVAKDPAPPLAKAAPVPLAKDPASTQAREPAAAQFRPAAAAAAPAAAEPRQGARAPRGGLVSARGEAAAERVARLLDTAYAALVADQRAAARQAYEQVIEADPNNGDAWIGLATVAARDGERSQAERLYQRALEIDPNDASARAGLLAVRGGADQVSQESQLRQMIAQDDSQPSAHASLGQVLAAQGRWAEAQKSYFDAYNLDPTNGDYAFNVAVALDRLRQRSAAASMYRRALSLAQARGARFPREQVEARLRALSPDAPSATLTAATVRVAPATAIATPADADGSAAPAAAAAPPKAGD